MYRIFIVEDDDIISDSIADMLRSWGFEAVIVSWKNSCCAIPI